MPETPDLRAQIVAVHPNYVPVGDRDDPHKHIMGTFDVELKLVRGKGFTYEEAVRHFSNQTEFALTPVGKHEE